MTGHKLNQGTLCKHIWKCHNENPTQLVYANKTFFLKKKYLFNAYYMPDIALGTGDARFKLKYNT
jgi:hypothetical protein